MNVMAVAFHLQPARLVACCSYNPGFNVAGGAAGCSSGGGRGKRQEDEDEGSVGGSQVDEGGWLGVALTELGGRVRVYHVLACGVPH